MSLAAGTRLGPYEIQALLGAGGMDGENPASRELFYLTADRRLVAVPVRPGSSLELGAPRTLFTLQGRHPWTSDDVGRDGRFLAIVPEVLVTEQPLTVVVNWTAERGESARR